MKKRKTDRALVKFVVMAVGEGLVFGLFAFVVYIGLVAWV